MKRTTEYLERRSVVSLTDRAAYTLRRFEAGPRQNRNDRKGLASLEDEEDEEMAIAACMRVPVRVAGEIDRVYMLVKSLAARALTELRL